MALTDFRCSLPYILRAFSSLLSSAATYLSSRFSLPTSLISLLLAHVVALVLSLLLLPPVTRQYFDSPSRQIL
jgi:hypothetical protein